MATDTTTATAPGSKERALFILRSLMELVENDQVRANEIEGLTADEIIARAEQEAAKAVEGSEQLKNS
jgi:hypothetical protein